MATTYKVLGQLAAAATTNETLYAVPSGSYAVVSTLNICNRSTANITFRAAIRVANAAINNSHYIAFDTSVPSNDSIALTLGLTLANTDVVTVYAGSANLTFSLFGTEVS